MTIIAIACALALAAVVAFLLARRGRVFEGFEGKGVLRMYTVTWCGFCRKFADDKAKIKQASGSVPFAIEDIDGDAATKDQMEADGVTGFPTIVFKKPDETVVKYEGERKADKILAWAKDLAA